MHAHAYVHVPTESWHVLHGTRPTDTRTPTISRESNSKAKTRIPHLLWQLHSQWVFASKDGVPTFWLKGCNSSRRHILFTPWQQTEVLIFRFKAQGYSLSLEGRSHSHREHFKDSLSGGEIVKCKSCRSNSWNSSSNENTTCSHLEFGKTFLNYIWKVSNGPF